MAKPLDPMTAISNLDIRLKQLILEEARIEEKLKAIEQQEIAHRARVKQLCKFCSSSQQSDESLCFIILGHEMFSTCNAPIQVLTRPDPAQLLRSDEIGRGQGSMAVDCTSNSSVAFINDTVIVTTL